MFDLLIQRVKAARELADLRQKASQSEANMHVGAMASRYDTFKEEAQYLAGAQGLRAHELSKELFDLQRLRELILQNAIPTNRVCLGNIVVVENESGEKKNYLVASGSGGQLVETDKGMFQVVTPMSPLGRALVGKKMGENIEVVLGGIGLTFEVIAIE